MENLLALLPFISVYLPCFWRLGAACLAGVDLDFRAFLEPKGFLSTLCETRFNLVTTGADLQDPMPSELAKMYHETNFITVGPLLQQAKFCLMLQVCRKIASSKKGDIS